MGSVVIGIDIVCVDRIVALKAKFGDKFLNRVLNKDEIALAKTNESLAGFYAAKEAFAKALGTGIGEECSFGDLIIKKTQKNAPYLEISTRILKNFNIKNTNLSISHDGNFAIAAVIIEKN